MADETSTDADAMMLSPRDIANALSGGLADLTTYVRTNPNPDPRAIMAEMERLAMNFVRRLPVPQMQADDAGTEARPN